MLFGENLCSFLWCVVGCLLFLPRTICIFTCELCTRCSFYLVIHLFILQQGLDVRGCSRAASVRPPAICPPSPLLLHPKRVPGLFVSLIDPFDGAQRVGQTSAEPLAPRCPQSIRSGTVRAGPRVASHHTFAGNYDFPLPREICPD